MAKKEKEVAVLAYFVMNTATNAMPQINNLDLKTPGCEAHGLLLTVINY